MPEPGIVRTGREDRYWNNSKRNHKERSVVYSSPGFGKSHSVNPKWAYDWTAKQFYKEGSERYQQIRTATGYEFGDEWVPTAGSPPKTPPQTQVNQPFPQAASSSTQPRVSSPSPPPAAEASSSARTNPRARSVSPPRGLPHMPPNAFEVGWGVKHAIRTNPNILANGDFSQSVNYIKSKNPFSAITAEKCKALYSKTFGGGGSSQYALSRYLREVRRSMRR